MEWCIVEDGKRVLEGNVTADTWQQGLRNVMTYLQDNRAMVLNGYRSVQRQGEALHFWITVSMLPSKIRVRHRPPAAPSVLVCAPDAFRTAAAGLSSRSTAVSPL